MEGVITFMELIGCIIGVIVAIGLLVLLVVGIFLNIEDLLNK